MRKLYFSKKLVWTFLAVMMSTGMMMAQNTYSGGAGTTGDPFQLSTVDDVLTLDTAAGDWGKSYILTADIDMDGQTFYPIGGKNDGTEQPFTGVFDGNFHVLKNLTVTKRPGADGVFGGTFGLLSGGAAAIKNLGLVNLNMDLAQERVGGIVGFNRWGATVSNCFINGGMIKANGRLGGISGVPQNAITNCFVKATVQDSWGNSGGIAGHVWNNTPLMKNVVFYGKRLGGGGALFGKHAQAADIKNAYYISNNGIDKAVADDSESDTATIYKLDKIAMADSANYMLFEDTMWVMNPVEGGYPVLKGFDPMYFADVAIQHYSGGKGTVEAPWELATAQDILDLDTAAGHWNSHFVLTADIDMADTIIVPIAPDDSKTFGGTIDGQSHVIKNLRIDDDAKYVGFIGVLSGGSSLIQNLGFDNLSINTTQTFVGGIAGMARWATNIKNSFVINSSIVSTNGRVAGLVGKGDGVTITDCFSNANVVGAWTLGGLIGEVNDWATNACTNVAFYGTMTPAGGAITRSTGRAKTTITNAYYAATVNGEDADATELSLTELTDSTKYAGLDFDNVWMMKDASVAVLKSFPMSAFESLPALVAIADAGDDQETMMGEYVMLDGSNSIGLGLSYAWTAPEGIMINDSIATPSFYAPQGLDADTTLEFILVVSSDPLVSEPDTVKVTVKAEYRAIAEISQGSWKFVSATNVKDGQEPTNAFDGDITTAVYTDWTDATQAFPFEFVIDLNAKADIEALQYTPRQDQWGPNGAVSAYRIYISEDGQNWGEVVKKGTFMYPTPVDANDKTYYHKQQYTVFKEKVTGQFVKFVADTALLTDAATQSQMGINELQLFGKSLETAIVAPIGISPTNDNVELNGTIKIANGGFDSVKPGDWAKLAVDVPQDDLYLMKFRVANGAWWTPSETAFELEVGGTMVDSVRVPKTGGWGPNLWVVSDTFRIAKGDSTIFKLTGRSTGAFCWNMDSIVLYQYNKINEVKDIPAKLEVQETQTVQITYTIKPDRANAVLTSFETADASIATVDAMGVITGKTIGMTKVYTSISDGVNPSFMDSVEVEVTSFLTYVDSIKVMPDMYTVEGGGTDFTDMLTVQFYPANTSNQEYIWKSSNPSAVSVQNGKLIALGVGEATVTATTLEGNKKATSVITVTPRRVTSIEVSPAEVTLDLDGSILDYVKTLTITVLPVTADDRTYTIVSSDENIVSVNESKRRITGENPGEAFVIVTSNDGALKDTCFVTVIKPSGIENVSRGASALSVYPNPAQQGGSFVFELPESQAQATVNVYDINGQRVMSQVVSGNGAQTITMDDRFKAGVYIIKASMDSKVFIGKLTVE